eukprot:3714577-Rhodomonas_salina.2
MFRLSLCAAIVASASAFAPSGVLPTAPRESPSLLSRIPKKIGTQIDWQRISQQDPLFAGVG